MTTFEKDPDAKLDYVFDWTDWLEDAETISDRTVTVDSGLTKVSDDESTGLVTAWLSGGTLGSTYRVACKITTSVGRIDERSFDVYIVQK